MLCIVVAAIASNASAAVVTYTMSYHDFGTGTPTVNSWAVYASVSADAAGLFGFGVDLLPYTNGSLFQNRANGVVMTDSATDEILNLGFTTGRTQDVAAGKLSGLADLGAGAAMRPVYGIGQHIDKLDNYIPANFDVQSATFGGGRAVNYGVETYTPPGVTARNMFLLGRGTWTGATMPDFDKLSVDSKASVYLNTSGTANTVATLQYAYRALLFIDNFTRFSLDPTGTFTNQAIGGSIAVTGANNSYVSEVDQLVVNSVTGSAPIATIGSEAGNIYVMAKLTGTQAQIDAFLNDPGVIADVGAGDSQFAPLHAAYDAQFGGGGFNALFKFPSTAGVRTINWDTDGIGVTVDQLAVVPEPACIGIVGCVTILLSRRRNRAWCD
jgi:hypothetical protein